jgi:predicted dehydrogenase
LIGCGKWGANILRDLIVCGCDVSVVARSEESRRRAEAGGAATIVSSIGELDPVAGTVVATTVASHAVVIEEALGLGVPIFTEKPMTDDPAAADRLVSLGGDRIFVMDKWRYHPGIEMLGAIARSGELGDVVGLSCIRTGWGNSHPDTDAIWVLCPHDLSISIEILGHVPQPRAAVFEHTGAELTGLRGMLGWDPWLVVHDSIGGPRQQRCVELSCRDGRAVLADPYDPHVQIFHGSVPSPSGEPVLETRSISPEWPLVRELRAFLDHLGGGPPPRSSAREGAEIVAVIARLRELAGQKVRP